jgi:hypothetical protein
MKRRIWLALGLLMGMVQSGWTADPSPDTLQQDFNRKYQQYLRADSQMLLPLPSLEMGAWKRLLESGTLEKIYSEPNVYYNAKVYTLTLFRAKGNGEYYLDAKGGFWGMDELVYGPLSEKDFE